jgi:hypothetical protein
MKNPRSPTGHATLKRFLPEKIKKSDAYIGNAANPNREAMNAEHAALR